jgi:hypothetical protein
MCYPLQSSLSCISVAEAYRVENRKSLAVSAGRIGRQPCFHSSLLEPLARLHSPPTSASAFLSSPVTAERDKRCLHFVDERNDASSRTLVRGNSSAIDTPAETLRVFRVDKHSRSGSGYSWMQIVMCAVRSTCEKRTLETITRLIGRVLSTSTWYLASQCCSGYDNGGAERGNTGCW